jgi:hypothetical protein
MQIHGRDLHVHLHHFQNRVAEVNAGGHHIVSQQSSTLTLTAKTRLPSLSGGDFLHLPDPAAVPSYIPGIGALQDFGQLVRVY